MADSLSRIDIDTAHGFNHAYPYTDYHEMNLDYLLKSYKNIIDKVNAIIDAVNRHQIEYEEAMARLIAVENEIATFEDDVRNAFAELESYYEAKFAQQEAALQAALQATIDEVNAEIIRLENEVNQQLTEFRNEFAQLKTEMLNELARVIAEVNRTIIQLQSIMDANNEYVFQYVENRLNEFINSFPEIITVYVYNPARGRVTDIQTAVNDLYSIAAIWGLTAWQYDSLELTAEEYDDLELTAYEYDTLGYKLLYKDPDYYMLSPFTGEVVPVKEVVMDLAHLHMDEGAISAAEYDALELAAEDYDFEELTAFQYDWFANEILAA